MTPGSRPDDLRATVGVAGWRGVLTDPAGRTVWTCRHTHPTTDQARRCAERDRAVPGLADLGWRLRQLRRAAGLSQAQVADALECSPSTVSRVETGAVLPTPRDVGDLAGLYHTAPQDRDQLVAAARGARAARAAWATHQHHQAADR